MHQGTPAEKLVECQSTRRFSGLPPEEEVIELDEVTKRMKYTCEVSSSKLCLRVKFLTMGERAAVNKALPSGEVCDDVWPEPHPPLLSYGDGLSEGLSLFFSVFLRSRSRSCCFDLVSLCSLSFFVIGVITFWSLFSIKLRLRSWLLEEFLELPYDASNRDEVVDFDLGVDVAKLDM